MPTIPYLALEWAWFLPGNQIRDEALTSAPVRTDLEALAYLPVLSREETWVEIMYQNRKGWVDTLWEPPHRRRGARRGIVRHRLEPVYASDSSILSRAKKILGVRGSEVKVGAYNLFTDVEDQELLTFLDSAAVAAEEAYSPAMAACPRAIPIARLFSSNIQAGHAVAGILAFYAEGSSRVDLARTLVHEITHLLNARSLAWNLPPWLEEGMATDLGSVWVENSLDVTSDPRVGADQRLRIEGFEARLLLLEQLRRNGKLPALGPLLHLEQKAFLTLDPRSYSYAHSAAFIRYLGEGEDGRLAPGFHKFLKRIADGMEADLLKLLGRNIEELDQGFRQWLEGEARKGQERLQRRVVQQSKQHFEASRIP